MTRRTLYAAILLAFAGVLSIHETLPAQTEDYGTPPEAVRRDGVPEGKIEGPFDFTSTIFHGTKRQYWVYVPAQYDASTPACTMVVQDGLNRARGWRLPTICDNLIHDGDMPVTIGVFVTPGVVATGRELSQPRFNRSFEYDSLGDRYARFLLEELLPEVAKTYNLSSKPSDRLLAGASSGGICAFNAAWERPQAFRRVICTIGTFVGLRGGDQLATSVRKHEPKPLRIFLQDGSNDLNIYAGDWWAANQQMLSSLTWAGYDVKHVWGEGGHNGKHGAAIMPEALRWIWRDYPEPIVHDPERAQKRRMDLLTGAGDWEQVSIGHDSAASICANPKGEVFFSDPKAGRIYRIGDDGKTRIFVDSAGSVSTMAFGPDDVLYAGRGSEIVKFDPSGKELPFLNATSCSYLVALPDAVYWIDGEHAAIWHANYSGTKQKATSLSHPASAMAVTTDHAFAHLIYKDRQYTLHGLLNEAGTIEHKQRYGFLHMPYLESSSGARAIAVDKLSHSFVATTTGIQVLDQLGRVHVILTSPTDDAVTSLAFAGRQRSFLYATTAAGEVHRRLLNTQGVNTAAAPVQPPKPNL